MDSGASRRSSERCGCEISIIGEDVVSGCEKNYWRTCVMWLREALLAARHGPVLVSNASRYTSRATETELKFDRSIAAI